MRPEILLEDKTGDGAVGFELLLREDDEGDQERFVEALRREYADEPRKYVGAVEALLHARATHGGVATGVASARASRGRPALDPGRPADEVEEPQDELRHQSGARRRGDAARRSAPPKNARRPPAVDERAATRPGRAGEELGSEGCVISSLHHSDLHTHTLRLSLTHVHVHAARSALELLQMAGTSASACGYQRSTSHPAVHVRCATRHRHRQL